jgi:hypothetical protein
MRKRNESVFSEKRPEVEGRHFFFRRKRLRPSAEVELRHCDRSLRGQLRGYTRQKKRCRRQWNGIGALKAFDNEIGFGAEKESAIRETADGAEH